MGSCISKCNQKPPPPSPKQISHVQDKIVISQPPKDPPIFPSNNSPQSHSSSSSSCNTSVSNSSCAFSKSPLSSTCSSSISNSSSNDFLWSYGKDNPHYSVKSSPVKLSSVYLPAPAKYIAVPLTSKPQTNVASSTPTKRSRSNSPVLTRQKSFRKEAEREPQVINVLSRRNSGSSSPCRIFRNGVSEQERSQIVTNSVPRRTLVSSLPSGKFYGDGSEPCRPCSISSSGQGRNLVSPSPSRRFYTDNLQPDKLHQRNLVSSSPSRRFHSDNLQPDRLPQRNLSSSSPSRRYSSDLCREAPKNRQMESRRNEVGSKRNVMLKQSPARNKENIHASPWNNSVRDSYSMRNTEMCTHRINPGTHQNAVGQMVSNDDQDSLPIDDIYNHRIALDCFIFL